MDSNKRIEQLQIIEDEILLNSFYNLNSVSNAIKLAEEDDYLYNNMIDYMKETEKEFKVESLNDIMNYTEEKLRTQGLK